MIEAHVQKRDAVGIFESNSLNLSIINRLLMIFSTTLAELLVKGWQIKIVNSS